MTLTGFALNDWPPFRQRALDLIETSLRAGKLVDGPNTEALEEAWKADTGAAYTLSCSSGTAALYMALAAAGVEGKEVIVPAFTFSGSVFPIIMAGAKPVYADIDPYTYCLNAETVARVLSKQTAVILPVHIHGFPVDLQAIRDVTSEMSTGLDTITDPQARYAELQKRTKDLQRTCEAQAAG